MGSREDTETTAPGPQGGAEGDGGESPGGIGAEAGRIKIVYDNLAYGVAPRSGPHSRLGNSKRAASCYDLKDEMLLTGESTPRRVCVTKEDRDAALRQARDADVAGHWEQQKTWARLKKSTHWPGYAVDTFQNVATCHAPQMRSGGDLKSRAPMGTHPYSACPCRFVAVDPKQMPESADGDKWMTVAVCQTTKFVEAAPTRGKQAECAAEFLLKEVFAQTGFARHALIDRGKECQGDVAEIWAAKLGICQRPTSPYRPPAKGAAERTIGIIAHRLAKTLRDGPNTWPILLPAALMAIRTSVNYSTGFAPLGAPGGPRLRNSYAR